MHEDTSGSVPAFQDPVDDGVDVSHILGSDQMRYERDLYELFLAHRKRAIEAPSVKNMRLCVEAFDYFIAEFTGAKE